MANGKFIVIEGSDGTGKTTQSGLLKDALTAAGHSVALYDFPQYDQPSSYFVQRYLNGEYGSADELGAYGPSLFYALDRFEASFAIRRDLEAGRTVLCNRYIGSNLAHQGQKFENTDKRRAYYDWLFEVEFTHLNIPKPDLNIVLTMPAEIAQKLVDTKEQRSYTTKKRDIHEADLDHLRRAAATYQELCAYFPETFFEILASEGNKPLSREAVHEHIITVLRQRKLL